MQTLVLRNESDLIEIGNNIKTRRKALNLSQDDLADRLLSTRTEVYRYEKGKHEMGICTLIQYAEALETTPQSLMPARFVPQPGNERLQSILKILSTLPDESLGAIEAMAKTLQSMKPKMQQI